MRLAMLIGGLEQRGPDSSGVSWRVTETWEGTWGQQANISDWSHVGTVGNSTALTRWKIGQAIG